MVLAHDYDSSLDIWSVGVLAYELLVGAPPFESAGERSETYLRIASVDLRFPGHVSAAARRFITGLLAKEPACRPSLARIVEDPWIVAAAGGAGRMATPKARLPERTPERVGTGVLTRSQARKRKRAAAGADSCQPRRASPRLRALPSFDAGRAT
jgi:serine/threonine protein kinase